MKYYFSYLKNLKDLYWNSLFDFYLYQYQNYYYLYRISYLRNYQEIYFKMKYYFMKFINLNLDYFLDYGQNQQVGYQNIISFQVDFYNMVIKQISLLQYYLYLLINFNTFINYLNYFNLNIITI